MKARLAQSDIQASIVPPYYWGVNRVTGGFAGSIDIRPDVMVELMLDVFRSLRHAGFREVYCITGHFDAAHGTAIAQAVRRANEEGILRARFVVPAPRGERLGLPRNDPGFVFATWPAAPPSEFADLHPRPSGAPLLGKRDCGIGARGATCGQHARNESDENQ